MIQSYKNRFSSRPVPAIDFDNFLKIRSEKQSIIQSDSQPIISKVQSFYQLLKLTKTGSTIHTQSYKKHQNSQLKNKSSSSKTINTFTPQNNQYDFNRFDDIQSDQAQIKKLNKMVFGLSEWQENKQKDSVHVERKINHPKTAYQKRRQQNKQSLVQQEKLKQRKHLTYSSCDGKKFRKFYTPLRKHQAKAQLNRINSKFTKTSAQINYPESLLNCKIFSNDANNFKELKNKIKMLQDKAKNQYGLDFDNNKNIPVQKKNQNYDDTQKDSFQQKENNYLDFTGLQLGPILANDIHQKYQFKDIKIIHKQNTFNDSSIPKSLIDIVQNKTDSFHQLNSGNKMFFDSNSQYKGKLKKGYLSRPKTFKPTYTYLQI